MFRIACQFLNQFVQLFWANVLYPFHLIQSLFFVLFCFWVCFFLYGVKVNFRSNRILQYLHRSTIEISALSSFSSGLWCRLRSWQKCTYYFLFENLNRFSMVHFVYFIQAFLELVFGCMDVFYLYVLRRLLTFKKQSTPVFKHLTMLLIMTLKKVTNKKFLWRTPPFGYISLGRISWYEH